MYVFGPGGVGKTSLLEELAYVCSESRTPVIRIDGRTVEPAPESFLSAMRFAMGLPSQDSPIEFMASSDTRHVLFIDTYETLAPLDSWLTEAFLPQLPENELVVLAGREPPSLAWRADPGWQALIRAIPLRNLNPNESKELLIRKGVPSEHHDQILGFTHGHPLALSLVADVLAQGEDEGFRPEAEPDVVRMLLERLVRRMPSPTHRRALEACAVANFVTEGLLAELIDEDDAHEMFEWLRGLSFIESGPLGIFPNDVAREALNADLRWRDPQWYAEIHRRVSFARVIRPGVATVIDPP